MDMRQLSQKERDALYKKIVSGLRALETQHGEDAVRWAVNKLNTERRERRLIEKERAELEERLAQLG